MIIVKKSEGEPRKRRGCLWTAIIAILIYVGINVLVTMALGSKFSTSTAKLTEHSVYKLELKGTVVEQAPAEDPFAAFMAEMPMGMQQDQVVGLDQLLSNIRLAKDDARIQGIYLRGGSLAVGAASAKAIRDALIDFKQSGKWIIAYADSYSQTNYYIASVADRIFLNPVGSVDWNGLCGGKLYYTRLLEKIGVEMQIVKVGSFKAAVEPFFRTSMSDEDRRQTQVYIDGVWENMVREVAQSRHIEAHQLQAYADEMITFQPIEKYLSYGLVDSLVYTQSMDSILRQWTGTKDYNLMKTSELASVKRTTLTSSNHIAVVYADGEISDEGTEGISGKEMLKTLRKVQKDNKVKAVVLRVNSPGGSANASEQIWHAVTLLQEKGLPVVVSMGDYAASGGYYISCEADYIYAEPTTLTGSIGIFALVPDFSHLLDKVGVDVDEVHTNKHAAMSMNMTLKGMDSDEYQLVQSMVERGYDLFTLRCAQGRHMSQDAIKQIGGGRIWLGQDAINLGLVDALGNIDDAVNKAAELAALDDYELAYFPDRKDPWAEFLKMLDNSTEEEKLIARLRTFVSQPRIMTWTPIVKIQ